MADRVCRAVGLDVHGLLAERLVANIAEDPGEVVRIAQRRTAASYARAIAHVLGIEPPVVDPQMLWEVEQRAFERIHREQREKWKPLRHLNRGRREARKLRKPLNHLDFLIEVNIETLRLNFPKLRDIADGNATLRRIARRVRKERRQYHGDVAQYTTYPDVRELVRWIHRTMCVPMYVVTGLERDNLRTLVASCALEQEIALTERSFCSNDLGYNKLSSRYWNAIVKEIGIPAHEIVMIGNEVSIDASCTEVGIPVIIMDRGDIRRKFYVERGDNGEPNRKTRNGVPYFDLSTSDAPPPRRPFIGFASDPLGVRRALSHMLPGPEGEVVDGDVRSDVGNDAVQEPAVEPAIASGE